VHQLVKKVHQHKTTKKARKNDNNDTYRLSKWKLTNWTKERKPNTSP